MKNNKKQSFDDEMRDNDSDCKKNNHPNNKNNYGSCVQETPFFRKMPNDWYGWGFIEPDLLKIYKPITRICKLKGKLDET